MENKGESDHFLEILENFGDFRDSRDSSSEETPFPKDPFFRSRYCNVIKFRSHGRRDREVLVLEPESFSWLFVNTARIGDFFSGCIVWGEFMRILTTFLGKTHRNPS